MDVATSTQPIKLSDRLHRFFYAEEIPYGLACTRIVLPLVLLAVMGRRWFHARELYSVDGATAQLSESFLGFANYLPESSGAVAVALCSLLLFFLFCSSIGWNTRFSLFGALLIYPYLNMLDSLSSITKYSVISTHMLLLLCLSNCGAVWSVDSWLKRRRAQSPMAWPGAQTANLVRVPVWPRRLVQLFIGIVYFGAAITKMHTPAFFSGDQMNYWLMTHINNEHPIGEYFVLYPAVLSAFAYVCIIWEVLFLFMCWSRPGRLWMVGLGVMFHLGTAVMLGLYVFPCIIYAIYLSFLDERDVQTIARFYRRIRRRWHLAFRAPAFGRIDWSRLLLGNLPPVPNAVLFLATAVMVALGGVELEYWIDPYGLRRPEGPYALETLTVDEASRMLRTDLEQREIDRFNTFEVGTVFINGILVNRKTVVRGGELLRAQCSLNPPHGDMWVQCKLVDANDKVIETLGQVIPREEMRGNFGYHFSTCMLPGYYYFVLESRGEEIARRRVELLPADQCLAAK